MRQDRRFLPGWAWGIVLSVPVMILGLGLWMLVDAVNFRQAAQPGQGQVVALIRDTSGDGLSYTPVLEYQARDGRTYRSRTHISSSSYNYRIGERVRILYQLDDPGEVRVDSFFSLYGLGLVFATVGALFLLILGVVRRRTAVMAASQSPPPRPLPNSAGARDRAGGPTTDPSRYGHVHEPKPRHEPTVRRMR